MKVILLRDVAKIGRRNEVVELPDGYALNQLIPKKWAEAATPVNLKKIAAAKALKSAHTQANDDRFGGVKDALSASPLQVVVGGANEQGHLFQAVHEKEVVAAAKAAGIALELSEVVIDEVIKSLGTHTVGLKHAGQKFSFTIEVIKK